MYRTSVCFLVLLLGLTASVTSAQTISLSGKVMNKKGEALSGAIVTLTVQNLKDTTDATGAYSFNSGTFTTNPAQTIQPGSENISFTNGIFVLSLTKPARVGIDMFDIQGNLLEKTIDQVAAKGNYRFDMANHPRATNVLLIRVSIGQHASTFRYVPLADGRRMIAASSTPSSNAPQAQVMAQAIIDSLQVTAAGYASTTVAISSYTGVKDITLDSITLPKFSFFVTSLKGLQELSNSQDGFGGDLRFGKTGPGAGLLGADSICQCIAEKSMPGSKVKQWRAFLSVTSDENGNPVNAIDRIGTGPWYDRLGRVVALTIQDLQQERPASADKAILNDLPNEDGVPNHQPDPNLPAVDNHNTMTGSNTEGRLHSDGVNATCQDWTSIEKGESGFRGSGPAIGFSWPQAAGGQKHWAFVIREGGCASGVTPPGAQMGPSGTVGALGGYGGFYCFAKNP